MNNSKAEKIRSLRHLWMEYKTCRQLGADVYMGVEFKLIEMLQILVIGHQMSDLYRVLSKDD